MGTFQKKISNTLVPPSQKNSYSINIVSMKITLLSLGTILFAASLSHALPAIDPSITVTFLEGSELVKLDKIIYTNGKAAGSFDLQLCINDTITNQDATVVIMEANTQTNIAGTQDATDAKCFDFTQVKLPSDKETVRYDLHLHQGDAMSGPFGRVIYAFRKLDKVTNFQCARRTVVWCTLLLLLVETVRFLKRASTTPSCATCMAAPAPQEETAPCVFLASIPSPARV